MGKNGDPLTGWMKEGVLEQRGCSLNSNNCPQSGVLDVGVPKLVSAFRIIKGPHLRGES